MEDETTTDKCGNCGSEMGLCEECTNCPEHCLCDEED